MTGLVTRFDPKRGYGFIQPLIGKPNQTEDVFVHASAIIGGGTLPEGAEVTFQVVRGAQGRPQAANVKLRTLRARSLRKPEADATRAAV